LLDEQGRLLVQSDGIVPGKQENLIDQHVTAGTYYVKVESRGGTGIYTLATDLKTASAPFQGLGSTRSSFPLALSYGDFNGDGRLDLATANFGTADVSVLLGGGDGSFRDPLQFAVGDSPLSVVAGDFDGDGHIDLATANAGSSDVSVL